MKADYQALSKEELLVILEERENELADLKKELEHAAKEKEKQRSRQESGIAKAKEAGVKFGRPKKEKPENFDEIIQKYVECEITMKEAAEMADVSVATFVRWMRQVKEEA